MSTLIDVKIFSRIILFIKYFRIRRFLSCSFIKFITNTEIMNATVEASTSNKEIETEYRNFVLNDQHPCIMAKALFKMEKHHLKVYEDMTDGESLNQLIEDLNDYISQYDFDGQGFESFIASFPNNHFEDEISFEKAMWTALQTLHEVDNCEWDQTVSDDPENPQFSFSLGGKAFYIIGMHPKSSRMARQAPYPTFVFNFHLQFDTLRDLGTYHAVRDTIRKNDEALQGTINPVLRDFGADSETKQYSGRQVEENWKCPFHKKEM